MSASLRLSPPSLWRPTLANTIVVAVFVVAIALADARWERVLEIPAPLGNYLLLMTQGVLRNPFTDPAAGEWALALEFMLQSVAIAWIGTLIGAVLSFPLAFLAASNLAPRWIGWPVRQLLSAIRTVPDAIFAIVIMLPVFGLGPLAGTLALGVGSMGSLGKLGSEVIEAIDPGPQDALRAAGATWLQSLRWAALPQALPEIVALWLYRFEVNIRASAILGVIGAGGIGSLLGRLFDHREWSQIGLTLFVIIVVTLLVDAASGWLRGRIIGEDRTVEPARTAIV